MPTGAYERFGLLSNPFRDLAAETLEDVGLYHVSLQIDEALRTIKEEVFEKENRVLVALVGPLGSGKTQRLRLAQAEAAERKIFAVYLDVPARAAATAQMIAKEIATAFAKSGKVKAFSSPPWQKGINALASGKEGSFEPVAAGKAIGGALNDLAPALLLLNDVHNLVQVPEANAFAKMLQEIADSAKQGVLVMFGSYPGYFSAITKNHPAFASRINRTFQLPTLSNDEAGLLLAKKLLARRLVEEVDPLYPFDREAVAALNGLAQGNPRKVLEYADHVLEYAAEHRSYRVDAPLVKQVLEPLIASESAPAPSSPSAAQPARPPSATPSRIPPSSTPASPGKPTPTLSRLLGRDDDGPPSAP